MDDTKTIDAATYKLTIAGEEYDFGQPEPELLERMILISHMNAGKDLLLEAETKWIASAAGPETWRIIMKRFVNGEVGIQDLVTAMSDLAKAIAGDAAPDAE